MASQKETAVLSLQECVLSDRSRQKHDILHDDDKKKRNKKKATERKEG
jgi:hypothetical protein